MELPVSAANETQLLNHSCEPVTSGGYQRKVQAIPKAVSVRRTRGLRFSSSHERKSAGPGFELEFRAWMVQSAGGVRFRAPGAGECEFYPGRHRCSRDGKRIPMCPPEDFRTASETTDRPVRRLWLLQIG